MARSIVRWRWIGGSAALSLARSRGSRRAIDGDRRDAVHRGHVTQMFARRGLVDGKIVGERQQRRRDHAPRYEILETWHDVTACDFVDGRVVPVIFAQLLARWNENGDSRRSPMARRLPRDRARERAAEPPEVPPLRDYYD